MSNINININEQKDPERNSDRKEAEKRKTLTLHSFYHQLYFSFLFNNPSHRTNVFLLSYF